MNRPQQSERWWKRLGWLVLIWAVSVAALGAVAMLIRLVMRAAGLTSG